MYSKPVLVLAALLLAGTATAQDDVEEKSRPQHKGPPEAALQACANLVEGDPCAFEGRRGDSMEGNCFTPDSEKPLACRPNEMPPKQQL